jgi:hypothetical protein
VFRRKGPSGDAQGLLVVWVFPEVVVCLDCGTAEFAVPEAECSNSQEESARFHAEVGAGKGVVYASAY